MIAAPTRLRHHGAALALIGLMIAGCSGAPPDLPQNPDTITYRVVQSDLYLQNKDRAVQDKLGFQPRSGVPPWPLELPLDWGADPFSDGNWRFQLNAWRMIDPLINEYFETGDAAHLHDAMVYVRDWYDFNISRRKRNEFAWYDMSTGIRAMHIAMLESARRESVLELDDSDRNMLRELAWEHIERTRKDGISQNNHGLFQLAGLGLLCRVYAQDPICNGVEAYAREELGDLLADQFTDEGVHKEHSPDYHVFMLRAIERIGALKPLMGDIDLELIRSVSPWLVFPDGSNARIGDSENSGLPLREDPKPRCLLSGSCFAVGDFTRSGYAIVRDLPSDNPDSMIFVTGMAYSTTHRHADALSFELFEGGRFLFVDGGKYGYDNTEERRHFAVSYAHNMVGFEQVPLAPNRYPLEGSFLDPIKTEADSFIISGDVEVTRAFTHRRKLLYHPGVHLRIEDTIETAERADYEPLYVSQLLLAPDLIPTVQKDQFTVRLGEREVTARLKTADCRIETARGARNPLLGWHSPSYNKMVPATLIRAVCPGPDRTIVWDIDLGGSDRSVQIGDIEPIERSE